MTALRSSTSYSLFPLLLLGNKVGVVQVGVLLLAGDRGGSSAGSLNMASLSRRQPNCSAAAAAGGSKAERRGGGRGGGRGWGGRPGGEGAGSSRRQRRQRRREEGQERRQRRRRRVGVGRRHRQPQPDLLQRHLMGNLV